VCTENGGGAWQKELMNNDNQKFEITKFCGERGEKGVSEGIKLLKNFLQKKKAQH